MNEENSPESSFDRIASYIPEDRRIAYYQYLARLKSFDRNDDLVVLLEGIAIYSWLTREAPALVAEERRLLSATIEQRGQRFEEAATRIEKRFISNLEVFHAETATTAESLKSIAGDFQKQMEAVSAEFYVQVKARIKIIDRASEEISSQSSRLREHTEEQIQKTFVFEIIRYAALFLAAFLVAGLLKKLV